jgi:hypothetical protein
MAEKTESRLNKEGWQALAESVMKDATESTGPVRDRALQWIGEYVLGSAKLEELFGLPEGESGLSPETLVS